MIDFIMGLGLVVTSILLCWLLLAIVSHAAGEEKGD